MRYTTLVYGIRFLLIPDDNDWKEIRLNDVTRRSKRGRVCDAIREIIATRGLKPGDKLGAERVLAERMNVQRLTVRRAIKQLCEEGALEQRPGSGTYVKRRVETTATRRVREDHDSVFAPTGNILISKPATEVEFFTNDVLPGQLAGWERVFRAFNEQCPDIRVRNVGSGRHCNDGSSFDCALVRPMDLSEERIARVECLVPETWFSANPPDNHMTDPVVRRVDNHARTNDGYAAVPLMLTFPVQAVNMNLLDKFSLSPPPSGKPWMETREWLNSFDSIDGLLPSNPFIHSPLNHLCRVDKRTLGSTSVNLDYPDVRAFLAYMKELWGKSRMRSFAKDGLRSLSDAFIGDAMVSLETFLHLIPHVRGEREGDVRVFLNSVSPAGLTQVLPRYLMMGNRREKFHETLEFLQFLAGEAGQRLLAENGFGIPYYKGKEGLALFCSMFPVDIDELIGESVAVDGFYENTFFKAGLQERIIIPVLIGYFNGSLSIDRAIDNIKTRTEQSFNLYFSGGKRERSGGDVHTGVTSNQAAVA